jgi:hypothetical protein
MNKVANFIISILTLDLSYRLHVHQNCVVNYLPYQVVSKAVRLHSENNKITPYICGAIHHLADGNDKNKEIFCKYGVCEILVSIIESQSMPFDENVMMIGLGTVKTLTTNSKNCTDRFRDAGICEIIVEALSTHTHDSVIICAVLDALIALTKDNEENRRFLGNVEMCQIITNTIKTHSSNSTIVDFGCSLLTSLLQGLAEGKADVFETIVR